jgi:acetyl esterase/lipase
MKSEVIILDKEKEVTLTTYLLDSSKEFTNIKSRPAILVLPGGGYTVCSDREAEPVAMAYAAEGYHAFVLRYSVGENAKWPNPLNDAESALELIRANCSTWGIDPMKIAVIGFSAGGHLAAALSTMGRIKPNAMILGYPCILEEIGAILATPVPGLVDKVDSTTPPTFLFATCDDSLVPVRNSLRFMDVLDQVRIPFEAHIFYSGQHGISLAKSHTSSGFIGNVNLNIAKWFDMSIEWLKQVLGDFKADQNYVDINVDNNTEVYSINNSIRSLLENMECKNILIENVPLFANEEMIKPALDISLRMMSQYAKDVVTKEILQEIEKKFNLIKRR